MRIIWAKKATYKIISTIIYQFYTVVLSTPRRRSITSLRYLRSPRELIRIAGSFPLLPQRLIVSGETRRISATSRIVKRSGKSSSDIFLFDVFSIDMVGIIDNEHNVVKRDRMVLFAPLRYKLNELQ